MSHLEEARDNLIEAANQLQIWHMGALPWSGSFEPVDGGTAWHVKEHIRHWTARDFEEWVSNFGLRVVEIQGQWGFRPLPYRRFPKLFAPQVVYVLERA